VYYPRSRTVFPVILLGLCLMLPVRGDERSPDEKKAIARSQHEMLMLLIEKGEANTGECRRS
jgi:hypothetical protein